MTHRFLAPAALAAGAVLVLAGCGSSGSSTQTGSAGGSGSGDSGGGGTGLHVASTDLGDVLVDGDGMTVYLLTADKDGESTCSSSCLAIWPSVPGSTSAADGVTGEMSTVQTTGGDSMVAIDGHPLYTYAKDQQPGDVTGEGVESFGGEWYAVDASGHEIEDESGDDSGGDSGDDTGGDSGSDGSGNSGGGGYTY